MRGLGQRETTASLVVALCLGLLGLAAACGGDKQQAKAGVDAGEPCVSPGVTENGCACSSTQPPGLRTCLATTMIWTQCVCPPPVKANKCIEGQPVMCNPCRGETTGRMTTCLHDGTFDCACASPAAGDAARDMDAG